MMNKRFLFITANVHETKALLEDKKFFVYHEERSPDPNDTAWYNVGNFGEYDAVHFELSEQGSIKTDASILSIHTAIEYYRPDAVILVGVAFGNAQKPHRRFKMAFKRHNREPQQIGDVLISTSVADYESGKIKNGMFESDGSKPDSGRHLVAVFKHYSKTWSHTINDVPAKYEFGLLLSGDKVVDDADFKKQLFKAYPRAIGGEMEGRGAYAACRKNDINEWIVVKAVCDWADGTKSLNKDENQIVAARSAVSLLKHIFSDGKAFEKLPNSKHSKRYMIEETNNSHPPYRFIDEVEDVPDGEDPPFCEREGEWRILKNYLWKNKMIIVCAGSNRGITRFVKETKKDFKSIVVIQRRKGCKETLCRILIETMIFECKEKTLQPHEQRLFLNLKNYYSVSDQGSKQYKKLDKICDEFANSNIQASINDVAKAFRIFFEDEYHCRESRGDKICHTILMIDTADEMTSDDDKFLRCLMDSPAVQPILIFRSKCKLFICENAAVKITVPPPDENFIKALFLDRKIPKEVNDTKNIREIVERFKIVRDGSFKLDETEWCIYHIVSACEKILTEDLRKIVEIIKEENGEIFIREELQSKIDSALLALDLKGYIENNCEYIEFKNKGPDDPYKDRVSSYRRTVAEYFADAYIDNKKDIYLIELLCRLLKDSELQSLLKRKERRGLNIVNLSRGELKYKLDKKEDIEKGLHNVCFGSETSADDKELEILSLCRQYRYKDALGAMDSWQSDKKDKHEYRRLHAALLNRSYKHKEAEVELSEVYENEEGPSVKNLLASYIIVNYIHNEKLDEAIDFYNCHIEESSEEENLGYVHRNVASAIKEPKSREKYYRDAIQLFEETRDEFGENSTRSNWGYALTLCDDGLDEGRNKLECAKKNLEKIGRDRFVVQNDLGINLLLSGSRDYIIPCNKLFEEVMVCGKTSMQRLFASMNLAYYHMSEKNFNGAKALLKEIKKEVEESIERVKQQYYPACAFLAYCMGDKTELKIQIDNYNNLPNPNRYAEKQLKENIDTYLSYLSGDESNRCDIKRWKEFYIPCGLFYWYVDPLKFLSEETINRIIS